jgi:hypothetical protein
MPYLVRGKWHAAETHGIHRNETGISRVQQTLCTSYCNDALLDGQYTTLMAE